MSRCTSQTSNSNAVEPADDWRAVSDPKTKKKIQNRVAQRTYRNKVKQRLDELQQRVDIQEGRQRARNSHSAATLSAASTHSDSLLSPPLAPGPRDTYVRCGHDRGRQPSTTSSNLSTSQSAANLSDIWRDQTCTSYNTAAMAPGFDLLDDGLFLVDTSPMPSTRTATNAFEAPSSRFTSGAGPVHHSQATQQDYQRAWALSAFPSPPLPTPTSAFSHVAQSGFPFDDPRPSSSSKPGPPLDAAPPTQPKRSHPDRDIPQPAQPPDRTPKRDATPILQSPDSLVSCSDSPPDAEPCPSPDAPVERKFEYLLACARHVGIDSFDTLASQYYADNFRDPALALEQKMSRNRQLPVILAQLRRASCAWSDWERRGYEEEVLKSAEDICMAEFRSASGELRRAGEGVSLATLHEKLPNLWALLTGLSARNKATGQRQRSAAVFDSIIQLYGLGGRPET